MIHSACVSTFEAFHTTPTNSRCLGGTRVVDANVVEVAPLVDEIRVDAYVLEAAAGETAVMGA